MKLRIILLFILLPVTAYTQSGLWSIWNISDENSTQVVDHSKWSLFLDRYVLKRDGVNLVNYKEVRSGDRDALLSYIDYLSDISVSTLNKTEQKVYWINLYNALTVNIILEHYPVKSIRNIKLSGFFIPGPWKKKLITIEGKNVSLDDIEHRILRPVWKDRRIHYVVNCASMGCPPLHNSAYTSDNINAMLKAAERNFINSKYGVGFKKDKLILSSIFKWFSEDFGSSENEIVQYIESLLDEDKENEFKRRRQNITYSYDWTLNQF